MRRPTAGFTMIEVLVAVLLLAAGLVGALAMQAHAMRARRDSALLSAALLAASGAAERIRANAAHAADYLGFDFDSARTQPVPPGERCIDTSCDGAQLARLELYQLARQVGALPGGHVRVCRDGASRAGAVLRWECSGAAAAPIVIKIGWQMRHPDGSAATSPAAAPALSLALSAAGAAP